MVRKNRNRKWQLIPVGGEQDVVFLEKFPIVLGSGESCDIKVQHNSVADMHLQFNSDGTSIEIFDLEGGGATWLDGEVITSKQISSTFANKKKPQLKIGDLNFRLYHGYPKKAPAPQKESEDPCVEEWFFENDGVIYGPITSDQMFNCVDKGLLIPSDEVWRSDLEYRVKAFMVKGLFDESSNLKDDEPAVRQGNELHGDKDATCPYCWHNFDLDDILFISSHPNLLGDPVLGEDEQKRFVPTRLTPEGIAIDAEGLLCPDMACPNCRLRIPGEFLERKPLFISIVGAPASGKSYFLTSSMWNLRKILPQKFSIRFTDVDAATNEWLNNYEEIVFFQADSNNRQSIVKTDEQAPHVYRQVLLNDMSVFLPLPCIFSFIPDKTKDFHRKQGNEDQCLVLYDNAGEHFQVGNDSAQNPGTQHLLRAESILFLFDPTEDPRMRSLIRSENQGSLNQARIQRQDVLLTETISRIKKYSGYDRAGRYQKPVIVSISKADLLFEHIDLSKSPVVWDEESEHYALDLSMVAEMSFKVRQIFEEYVPEIVEAVESFAERVVYLPNSALGHSPDEEGFISSEVKPLWVDVPFLYALSHKGIIPTVAPKKEGALTPLDHRVDGQYINMTFQELNKRVVVPLIYSGYELTMPGIDQAISVPKLEGVARI